MDNIFLSIKVFFIVFIAFSNTSAYGKTFDPHGERPYVEVKSSLSCGALLNDEEKFFKIRNECSEDILAIFRILSGNDVSIEVVRIKPNENRVYFRSYSIWYNVYTEEDIDSECGNGVFDFLTHKSAFFEKDSGNKLIFFENYEEFFAVRLSDDHANFHCHIGNIEKSSH